MPSTHLHISYKSSEHPQYRWGFSTDLHWPLPGCWQRKTVAPSSVLLYWIHPPPWDADDSGSRNLEGRPRMLILPSTIQSWQISASTKNWTCRSISLALGKDW